MKYRRGWSFADHNLYGRCNRKDPNIRILILKKISERGFIFFAKTLSYRVKATVEVEKTFA